MPQFQKTYEVDHQDKGQFFVGDVTVVIDFDHRWPMEAEVDVAEAYGVLGPVEDESLADAKPREILGKHVPDWLDKHVRDRADDELSQLIADHQDMMECQAAGV
jgi:hypothetical protein